MKQLYMSKDDMASLMEATFEECRKLRTAGQKEYAGGGNALGNFLRAGGDVEVPPEKAWYVLFKKHIDGIAAWCNGHRSQRENVAGRINDAIVYLCLFKGIVAQTEIEEARGPNVAVSIAGPVFAKPMDFSKSVVPAPSVPVWECECGSRVIEEDKCAGCAKPVTVAP